MDEISQEKEVWIFCRNYDLIISKNGIAREGKWKYVANFIFIRVEDYQRLINQVFIDDIVLLLRLDGGKDFMALANEEKIDEKFKVEKYLDDKYQKIQIGANPEDYIKKLEESPIVIVISEKMQVAEALKETRLGLFALPLPLLIGGLIALIAAEDAIPISIILLLLGLIVGLILLNHYKNLKEKLIKLNNEKLK